MDEEWYQSENLTESVNQESKTDYNEKGLDIPYEQLDPETLRRMIQEFVTRDGADWAEDGCTLEDKVEQVLCQLRNRKIKIVFDQTSETANLVPCD